MKKRCLIFFLILLSFLVYKSALQAQIKDIQWKCNQFIGLVEPVPVCSELKPCKNLLGTYKFLKLPVYEITEASQGPPYCGTGSRGKRVRRNIYYDGAPFTVKTTLDNMTRYYCQYKPSLASNNNKLPLVIFVHGSGGYGGSVYDTTSLRKKAPDYQLTDDSLIKGFILIAVQSRNLHWPTKNPESGAKFDSYHRNYNTNPDVEYMDKVIDKVVAQGLVDTKRIYMMGWSNGARFTAFYGLIRHHKPTPEGNRIAAVANFSGGDPFENIQEGFAPSCKLKDYPKSKLPLYMISRTCDGVACNESQAKVFKYLAPGNVAQTWIETLKNRINNPNVVWQRINYYSQAANYCTLGLLCNPLVAFRNHFFWPDGHEDKSGIDWEPEMLDFLQKHSLGH